MITNTPGCREVIEMGKYGMMTQRTPEAFAAQMMICIKDRDKVTQYESLAQQKGKEFSKVATLELYNFILKKK